MAFNGDYADSERRRRGDSATLVKPRNVGNIGFYYLFIDFEWLLIKLAAMGTQAYVWVSRKSILLRIGSLKAIYS